MFVQTLSAQPLRPLVDSMEATGVPLRWVSLSAGRAAVTVDSVLSAGEREAVRQWMAAAGWRERAWRNRPLRYGELLRLQEAIAEQAENAGFPFVKVWLDSVRIAPDGGVAAQWRVQRGRYAAFSGIRVEGDVKLPPGYWPEYLGIRAGNPYSRAKVLRIRERLERLLFVEASANPTVTFTEQGATVNLFLQKKRASRFDFIVGLLPQPNDPAGRVLLTGNLNAAFQNALNLGERFSVEFERLRPETQKLNAQFALPYCFGSPFGVDGRLNIFRRDSTWVDAQADVGAQYLFEGGDFIRIFWDNRSLSLQQVDTLSIVRSRLLPPNLDIRQNGVGIELNLSHVDYRYNPRRGWLTALRISGGTSVIRRNPQIETLRIPDESGQTFGRLYDTIALRTTRLRPEGKVEIYLPFFKRTTLKLAVQGGAILANGPVFANEQYRLGGNKLLRGFDEESLFATRFAIATAELRLLLSRNAFMGAFIDQAYLENLTDRRRIFLRPRGFGASLNVETKAGIFGITLAVGQSDTGQAVDFRAAKFHLGYVNLF